jgi:hypothetical protein
MRRTRVCVVEDWDYIGVCVYLLCYGTEEGTEEGAEEGAEEGTEEGVGVLYIYPSITLPSHRPSERLLNIL